MRLAVAQPPSRFFLPFVMSEAAFDPASTPETASSEPAAQRESRARLDAILAAAGMVGWELDVERGVVHHLGDIEAMTGAPWTPGGRLTRFIHPADLQRFAEVLREAWRTGDQFRQEFRIIRADGTLRWISDVGRSAIFPDGRRWMSGVLTDITERKRVEAEAFESRARLDAALDAAGMTAWSWTPERGLFIDRAGPGVHASNAAQHQGLVHPEDEERVRLAFEAAIRDQGEFEQEYRIRLRDGTVRWMASRGRAFTDAEGSSRMSGVINDVTDRKLAEQRRRLLVNELNHRVKNTLAVVQGMAAQTFRGRADEQARIFQGRLLALSTAHNVLTGESWEAASLREIAEDAVRPFRDDAPDRVTVEGKNLRLPAKTALALSMALHELGANAVKYGALSTPEGQVRIEWTGADGRLRLQWRESGGPPVSTPDRRGFGTRMIERGLAAELGGTAHIAFEPAGVVCTVDAPLPEASEPHA